MSIWDTYPITYRNTEVRAITGAAQAGECTAIAGLSGSGKSNLLGYVANRLGRSGTTPDVSNPHPAFLLVDCNQLGDGNAVGLLDLIHGALGGTAGEMEGYTGVEHALRKVLQDSPGVCLLFDRFDALGSDAIASVSGRLRALRDAFKYQLTYVIAARRPPEKSSELAELFYSHTFWLGSLSIEDAIWSAQQFANRKGLSWTPDTLHQAASVSQGYPSFLRAVCEAHASGCSLNLPDLLAHHPTVKNRLDEFWADRPSPGDLSASGLANHPFLAQPPAGLPAELTAKEHLLWQYFQVHPGVVCEKDDLIRAVWPEDRIFERGVRDDSLAQLVRRLREKVEADPSNPLHIHTIPGRGYRFIP